MKKGEVTLVALLYFIGSFIYMLACPQHSTKGQANLLAYIYVFYYLIQYSALSWFAIRLTSIVHHTVDFYSINFLKLFFIFRFIFFSLLINEDMPTYIHRIDSKLDSSIFISFLLVISICVTALKLKK